MTEPTLQWEQRIETLIQAAEQVKRGDYTLDLIADPADPLGRLGAALCDLARLLELRRREQQMLEGVAARINAGFTLEDVLDGIYDSFREIIPYNRIGCALLEDDGQTVTSIWGRTDQPKLRLRKGYSAPLAGSTLQDVLSTGQPRILNDLEAYLREKPSSESTRVIVAEGIRSSLTCPLIANGMPLGFLFFSSVQPNTYRQAHITLYHHLAAQIAVMIDKARLASELAAQKAAIERHNEELRRINEVKNTFVGIAAHDLRNPIAQVQMASHFLLDAETGISDEERHVLLLDVQDQARHMLNLLDDLLDVTQLEAGKLDLRLEQLELDHFLDESIHSMAQLAGAKGTHIVLESVPRGQVRADPRRLRQVMDNLLSNAVKYSPPGSTVRVAAQAVPSGWRISVQDEGPGVTDEDRARMFQNFARLSAQPTGGEKSTGLGLAITRRVVEAHGGQIGVDSQPGHGATFWVTLPA